MRGGPTQAKLAKAFKNSTTPKPTSSSTRPFSIRLSSEERYQLEREAGAQSLGTYVRSRLLSNAPQRKAGMPAQTSTSLSQILAKLGRMQLAGSLSGLANAARLGTIDMTPELERDVSAVCREVREIRDLLLQALGFQTDART